MLVRQLPRGAGSRGAGYRHGMSAAISAGEIELAPTGPPVERRVVVAPRGAPVARIAPRPVPIAERLLRFDPHPIAILWALGRARERLERDARPIEVGRVGVLGRGMRAP